MPPSVRRRYARSAAKYRKKRRYDDRIAGSLRTSGYYGRYNHLGAENKFRDSTWALQSVGMGGTVHTSGFMGVIAAGTGESQRIGRKITVQSIHARFEIYLPTQSMANNSSDVLRLMIGIDTQTNGSSAGVTNILETASVYSFNQLVNKNRFIVLKDLTIPINAKASFSAASLDCHMTYQFHKKLRMPINFDGVVGGNSEVRDNSLWLLLLTENDRVQVGFTSRLRYTDV